jgi:hypothetical protein
MTAMPALLLSASFLPSGDQATSFNVRRGVDVTTLLPSPSKTCTPWPSLMASSSPSGDQAG